MRLCIVSPNRHAWSETFIAAHLQRLPGVELVLTDGHLPRRTGDGDPILPAGLIHGLLARVSGRPVEERLRRRITALLNEHRIDLVLAEYGPTGEAMLDSCKEAGVPLVVHFHGIDAFHEKLLQENDRYRRILADGAALVVVSREMERQLLSLGAPRERLHYNCYGIDLGRFTAGDPSLAPPHFIAVGRFTEKKAPHLTLLAFAEALRAVPDLRLTFVGDGPLREACSSMVKALGLGHAVTFSGVAAHEEVARLLSTSRAFVQHSVITSQGDREGTPLAVLEAMATGLPVIATRHAGIADVVEHGRSGLLCDEHDTREMAAHMVILARDPLKARTFGLAGRERVEQHHRQADRLADLAALIERSAGR